MLDQVCNDVYGELWFVRTGERLYGVGGRLLVEGVYGRLVRLRIGCIREVVVRRIKDMVVSRFFKKRRLWQESIVSDGGVEKCVVRDFGGCPAFVGQVPFEEQLVGAVEHDAATIAREFPISLWGNLFFERVKKLFNIKNVIFDEVGCDRKFGIQILRLEGDILDGESWRYRNGIMFEIVI